MGSVTRWIIRRAGWVSFASVALAMASVPFTVLLYKNLRTDMEELLPRTVRSVVDLHEVTDRLESTTNLGVLVFSRHPRESKRFVMDLERAIRDSRSPLVARVEYRIDREIAFFDARRALFVDIPDLVRIRDYVTDRIDYEKEIRNPLNIFSGTELREPRFDFRSLTGKYSSRISEFTKFPGGFYASRDESIRVMLVYLSGKASGIGASVKLRELMDRLVAGLDPKSYAPDLEIKYTGDVENLVEEHASLIADLELSAVLVSLLVALSMLVYYRDLLATAALVGSLFAGTLVTFGAAYFAVGYLNANSAFLGSIVIGNGINFGIILLARYVEERRSGASYPDALASASGKTLSPTLTAALAAGLSYGSLILTSFRGFRQFGVIGLMGMVLCWLSAFVTLPAFLAVIERWRARRSPGLAEAGRRGGGGGHGFSRAVAFCIERAPRAILAASAALLALAALAFANFKGELLETDMSRVRDRRSMSEGSGYLSKYLDQVFGRYVSPVVILPPNSRETEEIARRLRAKKEAQGPGSLIAGVYTIRDFVPRHQEKKIEILRQIQSSLKPSILRRMSAHDRDLVRRLLTPEAFRPFGVNDLPKQVKDRFREKDGAVGRLVLVEPVFNEEILNDYLNQEAFIREVREIADSVHPGAPVVGQLPITVDMVRSVREDGPRATAFAFLSVMILVIVLFRDRKRVALVLSSLLVGVAWLAGTMFQWGIKINFLNFIALPITFGIGVDYAVNVVQRYRMEGRGGILPAVRGVGGAVALASLTTSIGYGSLLIAGNQGFVSFGKIAVLGEIACLGAALLTLPAFLHWRDRRAQERAIPRAEKARASEPPMRGAA